MSSEKFPAPPSGSVAYRSTATRQDGCARDRAAGPTRISPGRHYSRTLVLPGPRYRPIGVQAHHPMRGHAVVADTPRTHPRKKRMHMLRKIAYALGTLAMLALAVGSGFKPN